MTRRLILHIGYFKTGSTALQAHLGRSRGELAEAGVLYPDTGKAIPLFENHSGLAFQMLHQAGGPLPRWYTRTPEFEAYKDGTLTPAHPEITQEITRSDADTVVVSSEELVRFGGVPGVPVGWVRALIDSWKCDTVTVVCYVRRPDRYLESWYNQLVKLSVPVPRLSASIGRYLGTEHTDFDRALSYWAREVGCDELIVRNYEQLAGGSIVADFRKATGLPIPERVGGEDRANPRVDNNFIEYARLWCLFRARGNNKEFFAVLDDMRRQRHIPALRDVYVLDRRARQRLFDQSVPMNQRLGQLTGSDHGFFEDLDAMLDVPDHYISDVQAFRFWSPYLDVALRAREWDAR